MEYHRKISHGWKIEITYSGEEKDFTLRLRNPGWSTACEIRINGLRIKAESEQGYFYILRKWKMEILFN